MTTADGRAAPEKFLTLIRDQQRGRLKVFLGFAPGVGKTYEMLQEAQRLKRQNVDVVVGVVETHGRAETVAMAADLEQVPLRNIAYHGVTLQEMDIDAVLARRPQVALVDELAHTNAPGGRNSKRYQDVEQLLKAGINVISTMNIQHLESLYDMIQQFTGVTVTERVPDYILAQADQIVNVDLSSEDLQDRMRAGKIYPADRVERALSNFFTGDNLSRLRELALEEIAHLLDKRRREQKGHTRGGSERVMVCLSSRSPNAAMLLRKASRAADRLNAPWYAVYIQTPGESLEKTDGATQRRIADVLDLARKLGGVALTYKGPDLPHAAADFVREYGITHILLGRSQRPWYRRWFGSSVLDRLLKHVRGVDVMVVETGETS